jgi:hypothetical protein
VLYQTLEDIPQFDIEGTGIRVDNKFVFEMPIEVNIDMNVLCEYENTVLYEVKKPKAVKQRKQS